MRTVQVYLDMNEKYVLASPGLSDRCVDVYSITDVPDDVSDAEVLRRQSNTINATFLASPKFESRKIIRFRELNSGNGSHMTILMDPYKGISQEAC